MGKFTIKSLFAREVLDSRGNPTVEVDARTEEGFGRASVPSGASTGTYEAVELRDGGSRYHGKGVLKACRNVNDLLGPAIIGMDSRSLNDIDRKMILMDGTPNKSRLGANALLGVSLAVAKAAADTAKLPLFLHLNPKSRLLPVPLMNIINGGKHAGNDLAIQEFMIVPVGAGSIRDAIRTGAEVYYELRKILKEKYGSSAINVGDEGGFAPPMADSRSAFKSLVLAVKKAGYSEGEVRFAIDAAASSFFQSGKYAIDGNLLTPEKLLEFYKGLTEEYPILSIEDPFQEDDFASFTAITKLLGPRTQIIGDDLFVTNLARLKKGVKLGAANSILLKVNQIGTLTESLEVANYAQEKGYSVVVSHRSGETEDNYIADLAVALSAGQIKAGAPARSERLSKYNQLIRIEEQMGSNATFAGEKAFRQNS